MQITQAAGNVPSVSVQFWSVSARIVIHFLRFLLMQLQRPYQCLFMAACAHVWHYKCISRLIHTPEFPMFQCPNCRAYTDLNAEVDDSNDIYENDVGTDPPRASDHPTLDYPHNAAFVAPGTGNSTDERLEGENCTHRDESLDDAQLAATVGNMTLEDPVSRNGCGNTGRSNQGPDDFVPLNAQSESTTRFPRSPNIDIPNRSPSDKKSGASQNSHILLHGELPNPSEPFEEGPMTPRNDLGPLAFDGRAGRPSERFLS